MLEAKQRSDWMHTANIMTLLVNLNRDPKKGRAAKFEDFYPFTSRREDSDVPKVGIDILRQVFVEGRLSNPALQGNGNIRR